jgi:protein phosphatase
LTIENNKFFGITHIGLVRKSNQDRYLIKKLKEKSVLIAVADGLGVDVAGDFAADILSEKLAGVNYISKRNEQPELDQIAREVDRDIYAEGQENSALEGMGTTLICVLLRDRWKRVKSPQNSYRLIIQGMSWISA